MGCTVSKSPLEPRTVTIKLSGCSHLHRSHSSPVHELADGEHDHVVSLTSSTYGSLRLDSLPIEAENGRNVTSTEDVRDKQVETVNMWELMEGIEDEKAALQMLRGLMGKPEVESGNSSPRVYHTLEDVDTVLDTRRALATDYRFRRGSSMDSITEKKAVEVHSPMLLTRRSRALQISQEVIEELDDLRRKNLSRSQEFGARRGQGRGNVSRSQELDDSSRARRHLSQSQDLDSVRRIKLTTNQERDSRGRRNVSRSQEFDRPGHGSEFVTRHSSEEALRDARPRRVAISKPDVVLRSPMLRGLSGQERFVSSSSNGTSIERRNKPLLQGQAQPAAVPRPAGSTKVVSSSPERRSGKALEPRVASAVAALSRLGEQRASASERKAEAQSPNPSKASFYTVSKIPAYTSVATIAENTQFIVPQNHDGRKISTVKNQQEQSATMDSSTSEACKKSSSTPQDDVCSQESLLDDPISLDYELVTKAEVAEAVLRSGSPPAEQPRQGNANTNRDSPPLDPELLASFEEALEMFTADDWCTVRVGESDDDAVTSTQDADSPREPVPHSDKFNKFEILENHVEKPHVKKISSSKVTPLLQDPDQPNPLERFDTKCPPGGEARCVLYTTSLRGIRKTFEDCTHTRRILQYFNVQIDERDIAMHGEFRQEVNGLVGRAAPVPRLFIRGRYIGGAEEVAQMFEEGTLSSLLQDLPRQLSHAVCDGCGGVRFVPCATCCGSCKVITEEGAVACCEECNENGLCRCPLCL